MNRMMAIASLVLGVAGLALPLHAAPQGGGPQFKQSVSKKSMAIAAHAGVSYMGEPRFVAIQETSISYATNTPEEVLNFGNTFYLFVQEVWLMSPSPHGPWRVAPYVPEVVATIVCSQLNAYPLNPYQLCALPWASGLIYTVWKPTEPNSNNAHK